MAKTIKQGLRPILDADQGLVTIQVVDGAGKDAKVLNKHTFSAWELKDAIQARLLVHGLCTLLQQRTSDIKENPSNKLIAMMEVYDRLLDGEWTKERVVGARTVPAVIEVLAEVKKASIAQVQKAWSKLSDDDKKSLKDQFAEEILELERKRAQGEEVDLEDLI